MNSMSNGFLYTLGLGWLLTECCLLAIGGVWLPLALFLLGFLVIFAVMGCLGNLPDSAVDQAGNITALAMAAALVAFAVHTILAGSTGLGVMKLIFSLVFVVGAGEVLMRRAESSRGAEAGH